MIYTKLCQNLKARIRMRLLWAPESYGTCNVAETSNRTSPPTPSSATPQPKKEEGDDRHQNVQTNHKHTELAEVSEDLSRAGPARS